MVLVVHIVEGIHIYWWADSFDAALETILEHIKATDGQEWSQSQWPIPRDFISWWCEYCCDDASFDIVRLRDIECRIPGNKES